MKRVHKKNNNLLFFCIAFLIIFTIFSFNLTSSRYSGKFETEGEIIAEPILNLDNNNQEYTISNMIPGDEKTIEFSVSNIDSNKTNEVLLKYCFEISLKTDIPLEISLFDTTSGSENAITIKDGISEEIELKDVQKEEDKTTKNYKLKIKWDASKNSYEYANKQIICNIGLKALQVVTSE